MNIDVAQIFIAFIVLLFSLTVHEMAHAWTADRLGDPTARLAGRVSLNPVVHADLIGTVIFPLLAMLTGAPRDYVLVAAAGPASNLALAIAASLVLAVLPVSPQTLDHANLSVPVAAILSRTKVLNVLLAVFNMIPIPPLDGGNVVAGLLPLRLAVQFNRLRQYGVLLLYALIFSGGFDKIVLPPYRLILSWLPTQ